MSKWEGINMFRVNGTYLKMNEGDYGDVISFKLTSETILTTDTIKFIIEDIKTKNNIIVKECDVIDTSTFETSLSQEDTNKLLIGSYIWGIIQERDGELIDTLTIDNSLVVERGLYNEGTNNN